jgi:hypothetical protein
MLCLHDFWVGENPRRRYALVPGSGSPVYQGSGYARDPDTRGGYTQDPGTPGTRVGYTWDPGVPWARVYLGPREYDGVIDDPTEVTCICHKGMKAIALAGALNLCTHMLIDGLL